MNAWPDVGCDLWIISEWQAKELLRAGNINACNRMLAEQLDSEQAGYGLPDNYTCGPRLHVFGDEDCEVWLGCLDSAWIDPGKICQLIALMVADLGMAAAITEDGAYVVALDGRNVTGWHRSEVRHGTADAQ